MKRKVAAAAVACMLVGCLGSAGAFAADGGAAWSMDADCGACHTKEAATHEAVGEGADAAADAKDATVAAGEADTDASAGADVEAKEGAAASKAKEDAAADKAPAADGAAATEVAEVAATPLAAAHAVLPCTSCHSDEEALEKVHDGVTADDRMPKRLRKAKIGEELCLSCHGSYEELAAATEEGQMLVDGVGKAVNPHDLPDVEDHQKIDCLDCHSMHKEQSSMDTAMNTCTGCHHTGTFECGTCH